MNYIDQYIADLKANNFEGRTRWMIVDSRGLVTVGVGNMVPNAAAALRLPFRVQSTGDLAGEIAVQKDFQRVAAMQADRLPHFYYEYESLVLAEADIDSLLRQRVVGFDTQLHGFFLGYDSFPDAGKIGLLDMIYNLGLGHPAEDEEPATGLHEFTHFLPAVMSNPPNWALAAQDCARNISQAAFAARNAWTKQRFLAAAKGDA